MFRKYYWLIVLCSGTMMACTKEAAKFPYDNVMQFSIDNVEGSTLKGVIQDDQIIVYWPPYLQIPDSINANITVAEKAAVLPVSGSKVAFNANTVFTVTAENGIKKTYHLKPVINQPLTYISRLNSEILYFGENEIVVGDYFIKDTMQTKVYITGADKKDIPLAFWTQYEGIQVCSQTELWLRVPVPVNDTVPPVPFGDYTLKVVTGLRTVTYANKLKVAFSTPYVTDISPATATTGNVFKLTFNNALVGISQVSGTNDNTGEKVTFELAGYTKFEMTLKVPAGAAKGTYTAFEFKSNAYGSDIGNFWLYDVPLTIQ